MASTVTPSKKSPDRERDASRSDRPGYGRLLRTRGAWTFLLPGFAARQPFAMLTLSIVLLVQHTTGSYGVAGAAAAVTGVSMALFAPTAAGSPTATDSARSCSPASWCTPRPVSP